MDNNYALLAQVFTTKGLSLYLNGDEITLHPGDIDRIIELARAAQQPTTLRCECCGYLVTASEHRSCVRAASVTNLNQLLAHDFNEAVNREYPIPDSPHKSVVMHATDNRAAMWRGIRAVLDVVRGAEATTASASADLDDLILQHFSYASDIGSNAMWANVDDIKLFAQACSGSSTAPSREADAVTLLRELADATDIFMKGGVAPVRELIDKARAAIAQQGASQAPKIERFSIYEDHGRANMMGDDEGEYVLYSHHIDALARAPLPTFDEAIFRTMVATWAHGFPDAPEDKDAAARKEKQWRAIIDFSRAPLPAKGEQKPYGYHYEWAACVTTGGPQNFRWEFDREPPPEWAVESGQARNVRPLYLAAPAQAGDVRDADMWRFIVRDGCSLHGRFTLVVAEGDKLRELHGREYESTVRAAMSASQDRRQGAPIQPTGVTLHGLPVVIDDTVPEGAAEFRSGRRTERVDIQYYCTEQAGCHGRGEQSADCPACEPKRGAE